MGVGSKILGLGSWPRLLGSWVLGLGPLGSSALGSRSSNKWCSSSSKWWY